MPRGKCLALDVFNKKTGKTDQSELKFHLNKQSRNELIKIKQAIPKGDDILKKDNEIKVFSFRQTYCKHDKKPQLRNPENEMHRMLTQIQHESFKTGENLPIMSLI